MSSHCASEIDFLYGNSLYTIFNCGNDHSPLNQLFVFYSSLFACVGHSGPGEADREIHVSAQWDMGQHHPEGICGMSLKNLKISRASCCGCCWECFMSCIIMTFSRWLLRRNCWYELIFHFYEEGNFANVSYYLSVRRNLANLIPCWSNFITSSTHNCLLKLMHCYMV